MASLDTSDQEHACKVKMHDDVSKHSLDWVSQACMHQMGLGSIGYSYMAHTW